MAKTRSELREKCMIILYQNEIMNKGKIIEQGSQSALLAQKGEFYKFYSLQSEGFIGNFD